MKQIAVYISNLSYRTDRRRSICKQFYHKQLFKIHFVPAIQHKTGAFGLWKTFLSIVAKERQNDSPYFVFCEDDHVFTEAYTDDFIMRRIEEADSLKADILSGGVSWFETAIQIKENLFWLEKFNGMQFTVIYNRFYDKILREDVSEGFVTDNKLSILSNHIFVMYPFISTQKEFGYSDVTAKNNEAGYVEALFKGTSEKLRVLDKVKKNYYPHIAYEL